MSAERLRDPGLKGKPVAVGGTGPRSVISSCSYEARRYGVRSAMPTARALKLCPSLVMLPPDFTLYSGLSKQVFALFEDYTPIWEQVSVDEGYLDMTGTESLFGPPLTAAIKLRERILTETGLTCSIGIASNRLVAKVATDFCKPNNVHLVPPGTEAAFLAPFEAGRLPGCGRVTQAWLADRNVNTVADLQRYPLEVLERHLGKFGHYLHEAAHGRGSTEFNEEAKTRSISREMTFEEDISDAEYLRREFWQMAADLGKSLREENIFARAIRLKLRYPPFQTVTRSRVLKAPTQSDRTLYEAAIHLFEDNWESENPLRLIGLGCVLGENDHQLNLFADSPDQMVTNSKTSVLDHLKDAVVKRFGPNAIKTGRDIK